MPVKRTVSKKKVTLDEDALAETTEQYLTVKGQAEDFAKRQRTLRDRLVDYIEQFGEEDADGHILLDLPAEIDGFGALKWEKRVSRALSEDDAEALLKRKRLLKECQTTITVLDESKIEALFFEGKITEAEWDEMFPAKEVRALKTVKA
jgi:hypothetical protein